jgi:hypothetical protein
LKCNAITLQKPPAGSNCSFFPLALLPPAILPLQFYSALSPLHGVFVVL